MINYKEIFGADLQRKSSGRVYTQQLKNDLNFFVEKQKNKYFVVFKYNDSNEKIWNIKYRWFFEGYSKNMIFVFVCKNEYENFEYHPINIEDLSKYLNTTVNELFSKKEAEINFEDEKDIYLENWKCFE